MRKGFLFLICLFAIPLQSQVQGTLKAHAFESLQLLGINYYDSFELGVSKVDSLGIFHINYDPNYIGMALLQSAKTNSRIVLVLDGTAVKIAGEHLNMPERIQFEEKSGSDMYKRMATNQLFREQAIYAWDYLKELYKSKAHVQNTTINVIQSEMERLAVQEKEELNELSSYRYLKWYFPINQLIRDMPIALRNNPEQLPGLIEAFYKIDFKDKKFQTSGIFREVIEGHFLVLENMGYGLDRMYVEMQKSIDKLLLSFTTQKRVYESVAAELFYFFEKRSLLPASAYLAETVLQQKGDDLEESLYNTFMSYVKLKAGKTAPNIQLEENRSLADIQAPVLLVFGLSECSHCEEDVIKLKEYYPEWQRKKNVQVVYFSLDTDKEELDKAYATAPWKTYSDFKGYNSPVAKDYYITGTPTYYLLGENLEILVRPVSLEQVNTWVDYKL